MYKQIIDHYGIDKQLVKTIEELSELILALTKTEQDINNLYSVKEEIADVEIMLAQLKIIFGLKQSEVELIKEMKIERTMENIEREKLS